MTNVVVVAEARGGIVKRPTHEAIGAALGLTAKAGGQVIVLLPGSGLANASAELAGSGAHRVVALDAPALANYSGDGYARAILEVLPELDASVVLMPHTAMGKDLMPRIAARLGAGMVSDAVDLHYEGGRFGATKPVYAGKATLRAMAKGKPFVATLRPNNFE